MTFWDWLWAWTRDPVVWDWFRPATAALLGALVGGGFTLLGQRQSAAQQAAREDALAVRERENSFRDQSRGDAKELFSAFTELHRDIQNAPMALGDYVNGRNWAPKWKEIWTTSRSLDLDVRASLLTDSSIREQVRKLVRYLDSAEDYSDGQSAPFGGFRSPLNTNLHYMVLQLSAEGVDLVGAYLRGEPHTTTRQPVWDDMARADSDYAAWEAYQVERMEEMAEERAAEVERED